MSVEGDGPGGARFAPSRRQVVIGSGVALGALALASAPLLRSLIESLSGTLRPAVGIVAPRASRYPDLLERLEAGVRAGLAAAGQSDAPVFTRVAASSAPSAVAAAAEALVEKERVDVVLVYGNPTQTAALGDLAARRRAAVIVVDPGAQVVTSSDADDRVLSHSLGCWQSAWALGSWSVRGVAPDTFAIASLYESGFDILTAFRHGADRAGGRDAGCAITHLKPGDVADAVERAAASGAGALFVAASGHEADDIFRAIAAHPVAARMPLLTPGLAAGGLAPGLAAHTALTWPTGARSPFEALGHDVGALIAAAVDGGPQALPAGSRTVAGERGEMTVDLATGRTDVPIAIRRATCGPDGRVAYGTALRVTNTSVASAYADDVPGELRTGWLDVYGSSM